MLEIVKGNTTAAEVTRSHDRTVAEVKNWHQDFVNQGTEALRVKPRDLEAHHRS